MKFLRSKLALLAGLVVLIMAGLLYAERRSWRTHQLAIDFGNGQKGSLDIAVNQRREKARGTLHVLSPATAQLWPGFRLQTIDHFAKAFPKFTEPITPGDYTCEGVFAPPQEFRVMGAFPAPLLNFTIGGDLPGDTEPGYYIIVSAGRVVKGYVAAKDGTMPDQSLTATPAPFDKGRYKLEGKFSQVENANLLNDSLQMPMSFAHIPIGKQGLWTGSFKLSADTLARQVVFSVQPPDAAPFRAGQTFDLAVGRGNSLTYSEYGATKAQDKDWDSVSGKIKIKARRGDDIDFVLIGVRLKARVGGGAKGTCTLDATGQLRGMTGIG